MKTLLSISAVLIALTLSLSAVEPPSPEEKKLESDLGLDKLPAPPATRGIQPISPLPATRPREGFRLRGGPMKPRGGELADTSSPVAFGQPPAHQTDTSSDEPPPPFKLSEKDAKEARVEKIITPVLEQSEASLDLLFVLNSTGFAHPAAAEKELARLASILQRHPGSRLVIEGHSCDLGEDHYNLVLSCCRADTVAAHLARQGIAPERIITMGLGEQDPAERLSPSENASQAEAKRTANRRARLRIAAPLP